MIKSTEPTKKSAAPQSKPLLRTAVALCVVLSLGVSLSACSWNDSRTETIGGVVGGVVGAVVGSKLGSGTGRMVAVALGATLGAMAGQDIAKGLTEMDKAHLGRTTQDTLEYGEPGERVSWANPDSGNSGVVSADAVYANDQGEDCRQFETTVNVKGEDRTSAATACRSAEGAWQVVEDPEA